MTEHSPKVWEATLEDVEEVAAIGPFFDRVGGLGVRRGRLLDPDTKIEVVQKNKVRGVDSATSNGINMATVVTEKLELPSTDANVAVIKWLRSRLPDKPLRGWVLDERRAYRQVPISPARRKWSVVALKDPQTGKVAFFVMVGHSFGLVSAVYNYNRRSAAITDVLRRVFFVAGFNFCDDKYGFEPEDTAASAFALAKKVQWWLGARFDQQKLQLCSDPIKKSRKKELFNEISMILEHEELSPGQAGKLRGKLMFGASQLWGKIGRAFPESAVRSAVLSEDFGYRSDASAAVLALQVEDARHAWAPEADSQLGAQEDRRRDLHGWLSSEYEPEGSGY